MRKFPADRAQYGVFCLLPISYNVRAASNLSKNFCMTAGMSQQPFLSQLFRIEYFSCWLQYASTYNEKNFEFVVSLISFCANVQALENILTRHSSEEWEVLNIRDEQIFKKEAYNEDHRLIRDEKLRLVREKT